MKSIQKMFMGRGVLLAALAAAVVGCGVLGYTLLRPEVAAEEPARKDPFSALVLTVPSGSDEVSYLSPKLTATPFTALFVRCRAEGEMEVTARVKVGEVWGEFEKLSVVEDEERDMTGVFSGMLTTQEATGYQVGMVLTGAAGVSAQGCVVETQQTMERPRGAWMNWLLPRAFGEVALTMLTRSEWGADPAYLLYREIPVPEKPEGEGESKPSQREIDCANWQRDYPQDFKKTGVKVSLTEEGKKLMWPREYSAEVRKIVIHHTASDAKDLNGNGVFDGEDGKGLVRAIYYSHAMSNGWGDVGYHFLIDPLGNIYEGRSGGDAVVGAHVYCANTGTVGISMIGNFENVEPTPEALAAAGKLAGELALKYGVDVTVDEAWHGKVTDAIVGHRDYGHTSCPGAHLYEKLDRIREEATQYVEEHMMSDSAFAFKVVSAPAPWVATALSSGTAEIVLKNTGKRAWPRGMHITQDVRRLSEGMPYAYLAQGKATVYQLPAPVAPGKTVTVKVDIEVGATGGSYRFPLTPVFPEGATPAFSLVVQVTPPQLNYAVVKAVHLPKPLPPGADGAARIELRNLSSIVWKAKGRYRVYIAPLTDEAKGFAKEGDVLATLEADTKPGEIGVFTFAVRAPVAAGRYTMRFAPRVEGSAFLPDYKLSYDTIVRKTQFKVALASTRTELKQRMAALEERRVVVRLKNTGEVVWTPEKLDMRVTQQGALLVTPEAWTKEVQPGETGSFGFVVQAPLSEGVYPLVVQPVWEGNTENLVEKVRGTVTVATPQFAGSPAPRKVALTLAKGGEERVVVKYKNTGTVAWRKSGEGRTVLRLVGNSVPSEVRASGWESDTVITSLTEEQVLPGETGSFSFVVKKGGAGRVRAEVAVSLFAKEAMTGTPVLLDITQPRRVAEATLGTILSEKVRRTAVTKEVAAVDSTLGPVVRIRLGFSAARAEIGGGMFRIEDAAGKFLFRGSYADIKLSRLKERGTMRVIPEGNTVLSILNYEHRPAWNPKLNDTQYRGILELRDGGSGILTINELPMEHYLWGVAEPDPKDPPEKAKALAVLARSYAYYYLQPEKRKFAGMPYDGSDSPAEFQNYLGYGYEVRGSMRAASEATRGEVLLYNGARVKTPYFNRSDGVTRTAKEAGWVVADFPFVKSVEDPWSCGKKLAEAPVRCPGTRRGHGVGLSGMGAKALAESGKTYREIIAYFYTGLVVEKKW